MRRFLGSLALLIAALAGGQSRAVQCPALPAPYRGPIFDASIQLWSTDIEGLMENLAPTGVKRIALFANSGKRAGGPQAVDSVLAAARRYPEQIVPGAPKIGTIKHENDLPADFVSSTLAAVAAGTYVFIGEILYTHGDKEDSTPTPMGEINIDPLGPGTERLLTGLRGRDIPLMTHWEAYAWERDKPRFDKLYASWPQQRFLLPSMAYGSPSDAEALLSAHLNLWGIISRVVDGRYDFVDPAKQAKLGPSMSDDCGALRADWRAVLLKYSDRLMYGSDYLTRARVSGDTYPHIIAQFRAIAGQLPPDVAKKVAWDNAALFYARH